MIAAIEEYKKSKIAASSFQVPKKKKPLLSQLNPEVIEPAVPVLIDLDEVEVLG